MLVFTLKTAISALIIAAASTLARRSAAMGALVASLPITSILVLTFLYWDTRDTVRVAEVARGIFWGVVPSLALFIALPLLLRAGVRFVPAMLMSCALTAAGYVIYIRLAAKLGLSS